MAWPALRKVAQGLEQGFMSAHSIAETYAALTRLPVQPRIQPMEAQRIIGENILPHFEVVTLTKEDYETALQDVARHGIPGARIYDLLLLRCAAKCDAERIYTFNLVDFTQMAAPPLREKISSP